MSNRAAVQIDGGDRERLDAVVHGESPARVPELVKAILIDAKRKNGFALPDRFSRQASHQYDGKQVTILRDPRDELLERGFESSEFFSVIFPGHGYRLEVVFDRSERYSRRILSSRSRSGRMAFAGSLFCSELQSMVPLTADLST